MELPNWLAQATSLAIVSNQRGVARGLVKSADASEIIERLIQDELALCEASITEFRYCPNDHPACCSGPKPSPWRLLQLAAELDIDLGNSWLIGDSEKRGSRRQGRGLKNRIGRRHAHRRSAADLTASSLLDASHLILARSGAGDELVIT